LFCLVDIVLTLPKVDMLCGTITGGVMVYLQQVPNEDIKFPDDPRNLGEDWLIGNNDCRLSCVFLLSFICLAYAWRKFLNGSATDPTWLPRLPMTRAAVNAMTAVQHYLATNHPQVPPITGFLVAGASKRGWTTWTTVRSFFTRYVYV
jgi:PhoPQ-activated pathogenicity-related protein